MNLRQLLLLVAFLPTLIFSMSLSEKYPSYAYVFSEFELDETFIYDSDFENFVHKNEKKIQNFYERASQRGEVVIPLVKNHLVDNDLSDLFVYISMIESGFTADIVSPKKAVGLWQFMPATAKHYKLEVCNGFDERCDPDSSTKAAMDYLRKLHKQFGKWYLAVMAYNCGEGRLSKAIKKAGSKELHILINPYNKYLPRETREYIQKILLVAMIGEGEVLDFQSRSANRVQVEVQGGTKLSSIAKLLSMKTAALQKLNRQFKKGTVPRKKKVYKLVIPEEKMMIFYMKYEIQEEINEKILKPHFISHYVVLGDTLKNLAKEYNSTTEELMMANKLKDDALTLDMFLLIPVTESVFESYLDE